MKPAEGAKFEWVGRQRATGMIPVDDPALVTGGIAIYSRVSFAEQPARPRIDGYPAAGIPGSPGLDWRTTGLAKRPEAEVVRSPRCDRQGRLSQ